MELIPGLPDDLGMECLIRVDYKHLSMVASVCRRWKHEVQNPSFHLLRKAALATKTLIIMAQARVTPPEPKTSHKYRLQPFYQLSVLNPNSGDWSHLPPIDIPGIPSDLPLFSQIVAVGSEVFVFGGLNPFTWEVSRAVLAFSFLTATWRRGTDMPGLRRSFFGCAADPNERMVYIAGGHDEEKNALRSAMVYDVARDEWAELPDMAEERDECKVVFWGGKIHVIGGYTTKRQGKFQKGAEILHVASRVWDTPNANFLDSDACPRTCLTAGECETLNFFRDGEIVALKGTAWHTVCKVPSDVATCEHVSSCRGKLIVVGSSKFGEPRITRLLNLDDNRWTDLEIPAEYSGHVQCSCYLEI